MREHLRFYTRFFRFRLKKRFNRSCPFFHLCNCSCITQPHSYRADSPRCIENEIGEKCVKKTNGVGKKTVLTAADCRK